MPIKLPAHQRLLLGAVTQPETTVELNTADWEMLLRVARAAGLLGFLAVELERRELLAEIPLRAANQLRSGLLEAHKRQQLVRWELNRVHRALYGMGIPLIALKGMGYELAGLRSAAGRVFVDLDVLVSKNNLNQVEARLLHKGWQFDEISAYDEHYYRAWSQEIPALIHRHRQTEVDMHHTIAPVVSKLHIDTDLLFAEAITGNDGKTRILNHVDMVLHCAVNLFQNNDLADGLRDLVDMDDALKSFSRTSPEFWKSLVARSEHLALGKPLFYSLSFSRLILDTPIPANLEYQLSQRPGPFARRIMTALVPAALLPLHPDESSPLARFARLALYLRSHWIRMPPHLLLLHVARKSYMYVFGERHARQSS